MGKKAPNEKIKLSMKVRGMEKRASEKSELHKHKKSNVKCHDKYKTASTI